MVRSFSIAARRMDSFTPLSKRQLPEEAGNKPDGEDYRARDNAIGIRGSQPTKDCSTTDAEQSPDPNWGKQQ